MRINQNDRKKIHPHLYYVVLAFLFTAFSVLAQSPAAGPPAATPQTQSAQSGQLPPSEQPGVLAPGKTAQGEDKYIFGVLPNYRTAEMSGIGHPLAPKRKMIIAAKDSFAYPLVGIALIYSGIYQLQNTHPEFGQGTEGYAKRLGTSYADQVIGNFMTEGLFPVMLHQDPRYFRMSHGPVGKRLMYSISRIFVTKTDSGRSTINISELGGNAAAAGIGLSYYADSRNPKDYFENWSAQLGTDASSQILKEFWPDVKRWLYKKRHAADTAPLSEVPPGQRH